MNKLFLIILIMTWFLNGHSQTPEVELLKKQLAEHTRSDTFRVNRLNQLVSMRGLNPKEADSLSKEAIKLSRELRYVAGEGTALINRSNLLSRTSERAEQFSLAQQALAIADKTGDKELAVRALRSMSSAKTQTTENKIALEYLLKAESIASEIPNKKLLIVTQRTIAGYYSNSVSDVAKAMEWQLKALANAEDAACPECIAPIYTDMASLYTIMNDQESSLSYYTKALKIYKELGDTTAELRLLNNVGERHRMLGNYPAAIKSYQQALTLQTDPYSVEMLESNLADVYVRTGELALAFKYGFQSLQGAKELQDTEGVAWIEGILSRAYLKDNKPDSALYHAQLGLAAAKETGTLEFIRDNYGALAQAYEAKNDFANAYKYQNLYIIHRDSMLNSQVTNHSNLLQYNYNLQKKEAQIKILNDQKKTQTYLLAGAVLVLSLIILTAIILLRNNRQKQKAYDLLNKQKSLIEEQRDKTDKALAELQLTQSQLVQSEKMASLGELTAGIAHEIQNPLNFVNNFSEVNKELLIELKDEIEKGNLEEVKELAGNIIENEEKIIHHSKRAEGIVKGMLQHSRSSSAIKEPTDLNKLADEYFRLAYHGLRAKDKSFNATLKTDYDAGITNIDIIPQDLGRVILNLITNAFYAVTEKAKAANVAGNKAFEPTVTVATKKLANRVEVRVADNGNGISPKIVNKIFQPFFTTKPAGQGTGLGLSMSYDIVTQAHGGELKAESIENEGTVFTISLPV